MAEYVLKPGETHEQVARALLDNTNDPAGVQWSPRPDVNGGGVYVVNDEETINRAVAALAAQREAEAQRIGAAQAAADERDARADETGLTPAQLGFPANTGIDPGAPGTEDGTAADDRSPDVNANADVNADEDTTTEPEEAPGVDDPNTPEDESQMTPAQRRKARREAAAAKAAKDAEVAPDAEAKDEAGANASTEEGK